MRTFIKISTILYLLIFTFPSCSKTGNPNNDEGTFNTPLPHSLKGYELYSWQDGDTWNFTLITGTNRLKTCEEVTADTTIIHDNGFVKITVQSIESLKDVLKQLPSGENVYWVGRSNRISPSDVDFVLPPQDAVNEVEEYCSSLGVSLSIV